MTLTEILHDSEILKPAFVVKGSQYFLLQSPIPNGYVLGLDMVAAVAPKEGYVKGDGWVVLDGASDGWSLVGGPE